MVYGFCEMVAAITPGQSVVLYESDRLVGGGLIERGLALGRSLPVRAA